MSNQIQVTCCHTVSRKKKDFKIYSKDNNFTHNEYKRVFLKKIIIINL